MSSNICVVVTCEVKYVHESGVTRMWEVARFKKLRGAIFYFLATWYKKLSYPQRKCLSNVAILYGADGISFQYETV